MSSSSVPYLSQDKPRKSFLVLFPGDNEVFTATIHEFMKKHHPEAVSCKDQHLTLHYFYADTARIRKIRDMIDCIQSTLLPVEITLDKKLMMLNQNQCGSHRLDLIPIKDEMLLAERRKLGAALEQSGVLPRAEEDWLPHITLSEAEFRNFRSPKNDASSTPANRLCFDILRLTRWLGGDEFETLSEWPLSKM